MNAKELAELLMKNPDMEVFIDCCVGTSTHNNLYPEHKYCEINDVRVWYGWDGCKLVIECS